MSPHKQRKTKSKAPQPAQQQRPKAPPAALSFVNPYTFVPLPTWDDPAVVRRAPAGHHRIGHGGSEPRYLGSVTVELTCRSPLLIRNAVRDRAEAFDEDGRSYALFPQRTVSSSKVGSAPATDLVPFLPGSSLAGVFRSLHETLAGGCLRVFDGDVLPGYRDKPLAEPDRTKMLGLDSDGAWILAKVKTVDPDGVPETVVLCDEVVWTPVEFLKHALGSVAKVRTGAEVSVLKVPAPNKLGRRQIYERDSVLSGEGWVILLTHEGVRPKRKKDGTQATYYCATGRLEDRARTVHLRNGVWDSYVAAARDSDDMRRARKAGTELEKDFPPVSFPTKAQVVGYRFGVRERLFPGQVVWLYGKRRPAVEEALGRVEVQAISLSQIWRHGGSVPARERVPKALAESCADPGFLCPSCRVFGSADTSGDSSREARQRSYRGHVRFSDALPVGDMPVLERFVLAPLGSPRPGAGQMYLAHSEDQLSGRAVKPNERRLPLREWGSDFDGGRQDGYPDPAARNGRGNRPLRGRKHYWLTGDHTARPYFRAVADNGPDLFARLYAAQPDTKRARTSNGVADAPQDGENALISRGEAVMPGARFACTVRFENLTEAELGGLLAALNPALLLADELGEGPQEYGIAVGGGRPLGFGTCIAELRDLVVESPASRYLADSAPAVTPQSAVTAFRQECGDGLEPVWAALSEVLKVGRVPDWQIWYPPAGHLADPGRGKPLEPGSLLPSFEFWQHSEGYRGKEAESLWPLRTLPQAGPQAQHMEVVVDDDQLQLADKRLRRPGNSGGGNGGNR